MELETTIWICKVHINKSAFLNFINKAQICVLLEGKENFGVLWAIHS